MKFYRLIIVALIFYFITPQVYTQDDTDDIFGKIEENYSGIDSFIAEAQISVEMERLRIPRKKVKLFYKKPDKFQIEAEGFAIIPRAGLLIFPAQLNKERYALKFIGVDTIEKIFSKKYELKFRDTSKIPAGQQFFIWLDNENFLIRQIEMANFRGRLSKVYIEYGRLKEGYRIPSNIMVNFENIMSDQADLPAFPGRERFPTRLPRTGKITITFTKYEINTKIKDDLFERK